MHSPLLRGASPHLRARPAGQTLPATALVALLFFFLASAGSALLRQEPGARGPSPEERRQRMEERRQERAEAAAEMRERRSDPELLKKNAWWNDDANIEAFALTEAQRKTADQALTRFVTQRQEATEALRDAQTAFFDALAAGAPDLQAKKDRMVAALTEMTVANADLRIAVVGALNADQRSKLEKEKPRLLRSNWADPRSGERSDRRLQRRRGADPNR